MSDEVIYDEPQTQYGMADEMIMQSVVPSTGTKLVCTRCGREDFHTLILRRRRGLLEGLCKQVDGSGCYPNSPRNNCRYTDVNQMPCQQVAEWEHVDRATSKTLTESCSDHVGVMLLQNGAEIFPVGD